MSILPRKFSRSTKLDDKCFNKLKIYFQLKYFLQSFFCIYIYYFSVSSTVNNDE